MSDYVLSKAADADVQRIARNSIKQWGMDRAERYVLELHKAFETLSAFPHLGRDVSHLRSGYFRFEHDSHVVFFRKTASGILIGRILHHKQHPRNYL